MSQMNVPGILSSGVPVIRGTSGFHQRQVLAWPKAGGPLQTNAILGCLCHSVTGDLHGGGGAPINGGNIIVGLGAVYSAGGIAFVDILSGSPGKAHGGQL